MSLILDALRKSEAERKRGQAPDLFAATPTLAAPRLARPRAWPLFLLGAALLAAALLLWRGFGQSDAETPAADPQPVPEAPASLASQAPPTTPAAGEPAMPPRASNAGVAGPADFGPATAPAAPALGEAPATRAARADIPHETAITGGSAAPAPRPGVAPIPSPAQAPMPPPPAPPEADGSGLEALPPIAVLDPAERASLPTLKLSMHVWGSQTSRRFAIIDGQRVAEGTRLGAGVVEQIRPDGVVINLNGRRVLLPRP